MTGNQQRSTTLTNPPWRWRMIVRGTFRESWIDATPEKRDEIFEAWLDVHRGWQARGCRMIATMDDISAVGTPQPGGANFYTIWEIPDPSIVRELLQPVWDEPGELPLRLAEYFTLHATVGKPIITMELQLGGPQQATPPTPPS
jgi:hypothetical protein